MRMFWIAVGMGLMLCVGVFIGIDSAEKNIHKMQGNEGAPRAIQITPQNGKIEIALLGNVVQAQNPVKAIEPRNINVVKKTVQGKMNIQTNQLAQIGNRMGLGIRDTTRKLLSTVFSYFQP